MTIAAIDRIKAGIQDVQSRMDNLTNAIRETLGADPIQFDASAALAPSERSLADITTTVVALRAVADHLKAPKSLAMVPETPLEGAGGRAGYLRYKD